MKSSSTSLRFSSAFFFILIIVAAIADDEEYYSNVEGDSNDPYLQMICRYSIGVKTGTVRNAGTDSRISLKLGNGRGSSFTIPNLAAWGIMGPGYNYFEAGHLDLFTGTGPCFSTNVCRMTVKSDGTGISPDWFLAYVNITTTRPNGSRARISFTVNQWLFPPSHLETIRDKCSKGADGEEGLNDMDNVIETVVPTWE